MRNLINLIETATTIYYHGSRSDFPIGTILRPQTEGYVTASGMDEIEREAHQQTEGFLEQHRPSSAIPRKNAVFLVQDPQEIDYAGGYDDFVYVVEPEGTVTKANLHWYSQLYSLCCDEEVDVDEAGKLAIAYWSAAPSPTSLYEYLCASAVIVQQI